MYVYSVKNLRKVSMLRVFTGDNDFAIKRAVRSLIDEFVAAHGNLALERFDTEESTAGQIVDAIMSMPFLASHKMVVVSGAPIKDVIEQLLEIEIPESTEVILVTNKLDKRASYYKKISKLPGFKSFDAKNVTNLPGWVSERVQLAGGKISAADARFLVEYAGSNQLNLQNEIEKLVLYDKKVTRSTIEELCDPSPQSTVFQLVDAVFAGNYKKAEKMYFEQRAQKVEPYAIMGMLAWQLHILALVKAAGAKSADVIAKDAKLSPYVVKKTQGIARRLTMVQVKQFVRDARNLDIALKSQSINADDAMTTYLLKLSLAK